MKRNYKVKEKNKTKLKSYLKDGTTTNNKRNCKCSRCKCNSSKHNDI